MDAGIEFAAAFVPTIAQRVVECASPLPANAARPIEISANVIGLRNSRRSTVRGNYVFCFASSFFALPDGGIAFVRFGRE